MGRKNDPRKMAWVKAMEDYARNHVAEYSAIELAIKCIDRLDKALLKKWQIDVVGQRAADMLRSRKDEEGCRVNGSYHNGEKWCWKPYDSMNTAQIRAAFSALIVNGVADIRSWVATEAKCNELLESKGAKPLDKSWRHTVVAILDGEDEDEDESAA